MGLWRKSYLLLKAIENAEMDRVVKLLDEGADPNFSPPHYKGAAALTIALNSWQSDKILELLIEKGADPVIKDQKGMCPVRIGLRYGRLKIVNYIKKNFSLDLGIFEAQDKFWCSVFLGEKTEATELFEEIVVTPDRLDEHGRQLFSYAARFGNTPAVDILIKLGFPLDLTDDDGMTPLHWAAWRGDVRMVTKLIEEPNSQLNYMCHFGVTPLDVAIYCYRNLPYKEDDYKAVIQALLDGGAYTFTERNMSLNKNNLYLVKTSSVFSLDNLPPPLEIS